MDTIKAIEKRRSIRKFKPIPVDADILEEIVRVGRLYSSAMNGQPIRFAIVASDEKKNFVFSTLKWATASLITERLS